MEALWVKQDKRPLDQPQPPLTCAIRWDGCLQFVFILLSFLDSFEHEHLITQRNAKKSETVFYLCPLFVHTIHMFIV